MLTVESKTNLNFAKGSICLKFLREFGITDKTSIT